MIERVHSHLIEELKQNTRTDTIFVLTAIFLNLVTLGINSMVASERDQGGTTWIVFFTFMALLIVVNFVAEIGLIKGRQTRGKLLDGLIKMYKDQGVDGYYDASLMKDYNTRYNLFILVVIVTGLIAMIVPLILIF
jgi:hypothetical protein